jgi:hypothetical protein
MEWKKKVQSESLLSLTLEIQKQLAAGYFEFSRTRKAEIYRKARELLAHLWVELDILRMADPIFEPLMRELAEVIANLSGVLRKIERKPEHAPYSAEP